MYQYMHSITYFDCRALFSLMPSARPQICIKSSRDSRNKSEPVAQKLLASGNHCKLAYCQSQRKKIYTLKS